MKHGDPTLAPCLDLGGGRESQRLGRLRRMPGTRTEQTLRARALRDFVTMGLAADAGVETSISAQRSLALPGAQPAHPPWLGPGRPSSWS